MTDEKNSILFIQTGGTIDKDYPKVTSGYAFEICGAASKRITERARMRVPVEYATAFTKDSQEISHDDRQKLLSIIQESVHTKIIVTHGTDTMIETAQFLWNDPSVRDAKIIILTGSFKPETFKDSDADFNLGVAVGAINVLSQAGVYVAMNGDVIKCQHTARNMEDGTFGKEST